MPGSVFSSTARQQARQILSRPPYKAGPDRTPRPLAGIFHALGRALNAVLARPARWIYHHLLGPAGHGLRLSLGDWWPFVAGLVALGTGAALGALLIRRRSRIAARAVDAKLSTPREDLAELESSAAAAEATGDYEAAVRLRFRAGILRLAAKGLLVDSEARTDRELTTILCSETFVQLAHRHERIVFGGDRASAEDSGAARHGWPRVLAEAKAGEPAAR